MKLKMLGNKKCQFVENKLLNLLLYLVLLIVLIGIYLAFKDNSISVWKGLTDILR